MLTDKDLNEIAEMIMIRNGMKEELKELEKQIHDKGQNISVGCHKSKLGIVKIRRTTRKKVTWKKMLLSLVLKHQIKRKIDQYTTVYEVQTCSIM